ncbi:MAG TPA: SigE family RNA polymerase sigma factor [Jatrophihabitans sp.]|uniref:SigE family RNA polymerase sigma factor n=1 Tax=Jatrophihabitans sp. TaxID=1932789 RepID=UPI002DFB4B99|nr:SigE family RNA polymerase sigma factor [Jatrophihabitans sp.]
MDDAAVRSDFEDFAREYWSTLMSIGVAVSGSRAEAEDLVQTALANAYVRWRRIRRDQALAYLRRSILNGNVSRWRRHRGSELVVAEPPERAVSRSGTQGVDDRQILLPLLRALPPRQRAVLVLRYLGDVPDDEIAETLEISVGTVRSQAFRGLAALRAATGVPTTDSREEVTS